MKKESSTKQLLTSLDVPNPIPANLFNLDLSYAIDSFKPGKITLDDIPEAIPVFNAKTGRFKRFVKSKSASRRVFSMPITSCNNAGNNKKLPMLPTLSDGENKRSVSMYTETSPITRFTKSEVSYTIPEDEDQTIASTRISREEEEKEEEVQSVTFKTPKHIITDEDVDSIFSEFNETTSSSSVSNNSFSNNYSLEENILDIVESYVSEDASSILSNIDINGTVLLESEIDSIDDAVSFRDSLFGSDKESIKAPARIVSAPLLNSSNFATTINTNKDLPEVPQNSNSPIKMTKVRNRKTNRKSNEHTLLLKSNQSIFSEATGMTSLQDAKYEIKTNVRQRPFSYCLDNARNYNYSRFYIPPSEAKNIFPQHQGWKNSCNVPGIECKQRINSNNEIGAKKSSVPSEIPVRIKQREVTSIPNSTQNYSQPRPVSSSGNITNYEMMESHIQSFFKSRNSTTEKPLDKPYYQTSNSNIQLPPISTERENRFGKRELSI